MEVAKRLIQLLIGFPNEAFENDVRHLPLSGGINRIQQHSIHGYGSFGGRKAYRFAIGVNHHKINCNTGIRRSKEVIDI